MIDLTHDDLVVIDLETTGTNPFKHDVLALGLVPLNRFIEPLEIYVRHAEVEWNEFAKKNFEKFADSWQQQAVTPIEACSNLELYLKHHFQGRRITFIGHNIGFDIAFLRKLAFQGGRDEIEGISHRAIDTHTLLYLLKLKHQIPSWATTSSGAFKYFDIFVAPENRHTALGDAEATKKLIESIARKF